MWRAFFLAVGVYLAILGVQCLGVEKFVLKVPGSAKHAGALADREVRAEKRDVSPPPWAPWSLMSTGVVVCLYSFTIPQRVKSS